MDLLDNFPKRINVGIKKKMGRLLQSGIKLSTTIFQSTAKIVNYKDTMRKSVSYYALYPKEKEQGQTKDEDKVIDNKTENGQIRTSRWREIKTMITSFKSKNKRMG